MFNTDHTLVVRLLLLIINKNVKKWVFNFCGGQTFALNIWGVLETAPLNLWGSPKAPTFLGIFV